MNLLKQSTAVTIKIGPFVDNTDGVTPETGLTISQADIRLSKNGGAFAQSNNIAGATHDENGWYGIPLDTTDTNTLGRLQVAIYESGALPCFVEFMVVTANIYDSLISGTDILPSNITQIGGVAQSATDLKDFADDGYDPTTNKVQGVVLVDTTTTNTDMRGTNNAALASVCTEARLAELDAGNLITDVANVKADTAAILIDTTEIGAAGAGLTALGDTRLINLDAAISTRATPAQVNTEVSDVIKTDTIAEMVQGAPPSSPTLEQLLNYLYRIFRNKTITDATFHEVYDDAGTTILFKFAVSDDGTDFTKAKGITGP